MKKLFLLLMALPLFGISQFQRDSAFIKNMSDDILNNGMAYNWLHHLTKKIGNRLAGSEAFSKAVQWGKQAMQQAGADEVKLQSVMMPNWKRGAKEEVFIETIDGKKQKQPLQALALGNSLGTNGKTVTAQVLAVKNFEELEQKKEIVKGKIVFFNYAFNNTYIETFKAYGDAGKYRRNAASTASKYGALAVMIRSLSHAADNHPHTGAMAYNDSFPKIAAVALGLQDADKLYSLCQKNTVTASIKTNGNFMPDAEGFNVIGELKGTENPDKIITIGGHLDSWDVGEGANDDGAGCVQTMEVLRVFKAVEYKPKNTIRFVLFANEENGLKGGQQYAKEAVEKNEQHVFALETDAGGFTPRGFGFTMSSQQLQKVQSWISLLQPYGTEHLKNGGGGADIGPLKDKLNTPVASLNPDTQRYFDIHHAASDVFENVNKRELLLGAVNIAALIYLIDKYGL